MATSCLIAATTNGSSGGGAGTGNTLKMVPPPPMETQRGHPGYQKHGTTKLSSSGGGGCIVGPTQTVTSTRLGPSEETRLTTVGLLNPRR